MSKLFSQAFIDKVIDNTDIVSLISEQTALTKKGSRYFGLCPFHHEKSPSFSVNAEDGFYYCFGCKQSGNVISFVMAYNKFSFVEAIEFLATRANIALEYDQNHKQDNNDYQKRKLIYAMNKDAANFYYLNLTKSNIAKDYVKKRGLTSQTIKTFGMGYAKTDSDSLYKFLKTKGYTLADMKVASLVRENDRGVYDYFRARLMFPIQDVTGNIVAFGGRVFDQSQPKYLNSPETIAFKKHATLYNLNRAKNEIKNSPLIITEGYMDVISLHNNGVPNACASLGTAFNIAHANMIRRQAKDVVLCFDGDSAGLNAALKVIDILAEVEVEAKVLILKNKEDPDSYILKYGKKSFLEQVDNAIPSTEFILHMIASKYDLNDIRQRSDYTKEASMAVAKTKNTVKLDYYSKLIAEQTGIDIALIKDLIVNSKYGAVNEEKVANIIERQMDQSETNTIINKKLYESQKSILQFIIQGRQNYDFFMGNLEGIEVGELFMYEDFKNTYDLIENLYKEQNKLDFLHIIGYNKKVIQTVAEIKSMVDITTCDEMIACVKVLKVAHLEERLKTIKLSLNNCGKDVTKEYFERLNEFNLIKKKLLELKSGGNLND